MNHKQIKGGLRGLKSRRWLMLGRSCSTCCEGYPSWCANRNSMKSDCRCGYGLRGGCMCGRRRAHLEPVARGGCSFRDSTFSWPDASPQFPAPVVIFVWCSPGRSISKLQELFGVQGSVDGDSVNIQLVALFEPFAGHFTQCHTVHMGDRGISI